MNSAERSMPQKIMDFLTGENILLLERAVGIFGLGLTGWMIYKLGPSRVASNLHRVGWGFFVLAGLKALEFILEAAAWRLILTGEKKIIGFWRVFKIVLEA